MAVSIDREDARAPLTPEVEKVLVDSHRSFLRYLEKRLENRETAEELLQSAYLKTLERTDVPDSQEGAVAWFYRLLHNAMVDHFRRRATQQRVVDQLSHQPLDEQELRDAVCQCIHELLPSLKAEYATVLRQADLEGRPLADIARDAGLTVNNTTVRLHRARQALAKQLRRSCGTCAEHGCLDCTCIKISPK